MYLTCILIKYIKYIEQVCYLNTGQIQIQASLYFKYKYVFDPTPALFYTYNSSMPFILTSESTFRFRRQLKRCCFCCAGCWRSRAHGRCQSTSVHGTSQEACRFDVDVGTSQKHETVYVLGNLLDKNCARFVQYRYVLCSFE